MDIHNICTLILIYMYSVCECVYINIFLYMQQLKELYYELKITKCPVYLKLMLALFLC